MKKKVVILGGGFAGVRAAIDLQKQPTFEVTLVSDRDFLYLFPSSIWVPTRTISYEKVKVPLADIQRAHGFTLLIDRVKEIQSAQSAVLCDNHRIEYDYLVVAIGAEKVPHPGLEHTLSICGRPETSLAIREEIDILIQRNRGKIAVGFGGNPKDTSAVRGGPAFELLFNIHAMLTKSGSRDAFELAFFAPMSQPGERMGAKALGMIDTLFSRFGIRKYTGKKIHSFAEGKVIFEDESTLEADLILYIPGSAGHSLLKSSDLPLTDAGFVKIDDTGLVEGTNNVYAVGDTAALEGPAWKAKQGHLAEVMAGNAAYNIIASATGQTNRKGYREHLSILCLMDMGTGAALVYRDKLRNYVIPLPLVGHWLKKAWGVYARITKTGQFPRLPGL